MKKGSRLLALWLCLACVLGMAPCSAAWDGYISDSADGAVLIDLEHIGNIFDSGGLPSSKTTNGRTRSVHWANHNATKALNFKKVERDWSRYSHICFDMYSEKANGAKIYFIVNCDYVPTPGKTMSYQKYDIILNWEGWKTFEIPVEDFTEGNFGDWAKVQTAQIGANGWGCTPNETSDVYLTSIYGKGERVGEEDSFAAASMTVPYSQKQQVYETLGGGAMAMHFAWNAIRGGETIPLEKEEQLTTAEGMSFAPTAFFAKALGSEAAAQDGGVTIDWNGHKLAAKAGEKTYTLDGEAREFPALPFAENGDVYLPLAPCMSALGKDIQMDSNVIVIGTEEETAAMLADKTMLGNAAIMMNVKETEIKQEDWRELKDKWRVYLVGDENKDLEDEYVAEAIKKLDNNCAGALAALNKGANPEVLFGKSPVTETAHMTNQFNMMYRLVEPYGTYGSKYYKDPALRREIMRTFEWLYNNLYGQAEIEGRGWRDTSLHNWWDWYFGSAKPLCNALLIMEDDLTPEKIEKYLSLYNHLRKTMRTGKIPSDAASRVYCGTAAAALQEDTEWMRSMVDDYNLMLVPVESGNGVQEDDLYITHEYFAYSTAYGTSSLLDRLCALQGILAGTAFEFATPYKYNSCNWLYETFQPLIFGGNMTNAQSGRSKGNEATYTAFAVTAMLDFVGMFGKDDDLRLKQLIKRNVTEANKKTIYGALNVKQTSLLSEILADDSIQVQPYYKNKVYYTGDSVMHQRDTSGFALSMSSSRIAAYESINHNNVKGWYQGDGMLYMYVKNDPNAYDSSYWKSANPYHMPGTTVDTQEREAASVRNSKMLLTNQDFVGAAGMRDLYATAAMQLESYHNDVVENFTDTGGGGPAPLHDCSLMAKKSWFMFDDEVVALGSDINADDGFEVQTVVENRKLKKTETAEVKAESAGVQEYPVVKVTSSADDGNVVENTIDNDYGTRWSAEGEAWAVYELEEAAPIGYVGIAQYGGTDGKQAIFELEVSQDGENWTKVWEGKASGTTVSMEAYDMKNTTAKYVRYHGHGRTNSLWNSVTELKIFPPSADGTMRVDSTVDPNAGKLLGAETVTVDGAKMEKTNTYTKPFENPKWMHLEGIAGYYFPQGGNLVLDKVVNSGVSYLETWFSHGVSPTKQTYAYVLLPEKTAEQTAAYSQNPDIEILSNTEALQAVKEKGLGITGMVFWEKGSLNDITASVPMIVMDGAAEGGRELSICDPTKLLQEGTVTIKGTYTAAECDERLTVENVNGDTVIKANFEGSKGRSLVVKLMK